MLSSVARRFLGVMEPLVQVAYFSPDTAEVYGEVGVDPFSGYFLGRAAPMGAASPATVASAFYNFSPALVATMLPWEKTSPDEMIEAVRRVVSRAYARLLPAGEDGVMPPVGEAVELLRAAADACRPEGRVLFAAHAGVPWPDDEHLALWHGTNLLREYRGDGHIAVLVRNEVGAAEAIVMHVAYVEGKPQFAFTSRGWPEETYAAAADSLRARGFLSEEMRLTDAGMKFREMLEMETDHLAMAPFRALGEERCERLYGLLRPLAERIVERRGVPKAATRMSRNAW